MLASLGRALTLSLSVLAAASSTAARSAYGQGKLLVVTDSKTTAAPREEYSKFWSSLEERGYSLTFRDARNTKPEPSELLTRFEEKQYDGLVLFAPAMKTLPADLSPQALYQFLTAPSSDPSVKPGNVLLAVDSSLSETYRDFAREFSIEFDERDTTVYDPLHLSQSKLLGEDRKGEIVVEIPTNHTFISSPVLDGHATIVSPATKRMGNPILYSGVGHTTTDIPLLIPLLRAPSTAFSIEAPRSANPSTIATLEGGSGPLVSGEAIKLVSVFQTRVNSRIGFSGSLSMFSDRFWGHGSTSNEAFVGDLTKWVFQERGVVEILEARHYAKGDASRTMKEVYRIGEEMTYEVVLRGYADDKWSPPNLFDVQLEATMLDPHLRVPLKMSTDHEAHSTFQRTYTATFKLPDRHGVFTLYLDHRRQGFSFLEHKLQISITPLRHDEYERFILGAYPYYLTAASMVLAWLAFAGLWLALGEGEKKQVTSATATVIEKSKSQ